VAADRLGLQLNYEDFDGTGSEERPHARSGHDGNHSAASADAGAASRGIGRGDSASGSGESSLREQVGRQVADADEVLEAEVVTARPHRRRKTVAASWAAPLPTPTDFAMFEAVCPGAADRILTMAEKEVAIRETREGTLRIAVEGEAETEKLLAEADSQALKRGQYLAAGTSCLVAVLAFLGMLWVTPWAGLAFTVPLAHVAVILVRTVTDGHRPGAIPSMGTPRDAEPDTDPGSP